MNLLAILLQLTFLNTGAVDQHKIIKVELQRALIAANVPSEDWLEVTSNIAIERVLVAKNCGGTNHKIGCTIVGVVEGRRLAMIWYIPNHATLSKVLAHEFEHAIRWVTGDENWGSHDG